MKTLKNIIFLSVVTVLSLAQKNAMANSNNNRELLQDIAALTEKCVVRPFVIQANGTKELLPLESVCNELVQISKNKVELIIEGKYFMAVLSESTEADGGDLDDLLVYDHHKHLVADRKNVLAFDEVFVAMTGGKENFKEKEANAQ